MFDLEKGSVGKELGFLKIISFIEGLGSNKYVEWIKFFYSSTC